MSSTSSEPRGRRDPHGRLVVSSHAGVLRVAHDPETFSNAVSRHLQIPNGLDGAEHDAARRTLAPFFHPPALDALEPRLGAIATGIVASFGTDAFDAVDDLGVTFAVRAQSAWLGWSADVEGDLVGNTDSLRFMMGRLSGQP